MSQVKKVTIPNYPELSLKNLYKNIGLDLVMRKHLPDPSQRYVDREFCWNVYNTIRPDVVKKVVRAAVIRRQKLNAEKDKE